MAPIASSIEIARPPEEVFAYITDPSRLAEWQQSLVGARPEGGGPLAAGSKVATTRRVGRGERTMTMEVTSMSPPRSWALRGIDGPVRPIVNGAIEPSTRARGHAWRSSSTSRDTGSASCSCHSSFAAGRRRSIPGTCRT